MKQFLNNIWRWLMNAIYNLFFKSSTKFIRYWKCVTNGEHQYYPSGKLNHRSHSGNRKDYYHNLKCIHCGKVIRSKYYQGSEACHRNEMHEAGLN